ncbi:hypothetical protein SAMN05444166_8445 [Singulisphaera sp. GP187]|uniref:hypothetical protein n=1 Tax=Singulisphaera sp. GP187 TaxID=1882752 RepID=UPI00092C9288|nr:hypothetical protein [Singulisphaera sp. GP187]SIO67778.1 hypothetical protein SAMN05444166_8445 [Singulisphaera sp. GP187]
MTTAALVLGIIGTVLGVFNTCWTVFIYWNQVRVNLTHKIHVAEAKQGMYFVLKIANIGRSPVNIDSVSIAWSGPNGVNEIFLTNDSANKFPKPFLQPQVAHYYYMPDNFPTLEDLETAFPYKYWISVNSPTGEIYSIKGREVLHSLQKFYGGAVRPRSE